MRADSGWLMAGAFPRLKSETFLITGEGNIDADPLFASYPGFDFLLRPPFPCIYAGDPGIKDRLNYSNPLCPGWYENGERSDMGTYGGPGNILWLHSLQPCDSTAHHSQHPPQ